VQTSSATATATATATEVAAGLAPARTPEARRWPAAARRPLLPLQGVQAQV